MTSVLWHRRDVTSMTGAPTTMVFPQRDDEGNLLETQYGRSRFRDQQVSLASPSSEHISNACRSIDVRCPTVCSRCLL